MARIRSPKYQDSAEQFSLWYGQALADNNVTAAQEAHSLGVSDTLVKYYGNPSEESELPTALVKHSKINKEIIRHIASEIGLDVIDTNHHLNGRINDEVSKAMKILSLIVKYMDTPERVIKETHNLKEVILTMEEEITKMMKGKK